ncbi:hypothetical protein EDD18DRAFT_1159713 [Armillaria luteobubalina]|uniref:F-box domain-containing protein n=1 Tax=Armillaria luteobubalina TaxID=153913 RepID=A0AA39Q7T5_9AGAR|nr:hypothetical protein EDD18DRAFT_1159713 [Armillaria luteobubalina]
MSSNFGAFSTNRKESFPSQAITEILAFVHDPNTLKSCTLVCRDWEYTAQLYLFSVVHVGGHPPHRRHNPYNLPHTLIPLDELHIFRHQGLVRELRILQAPNDAFLQHLQSVLDNGDFRRLKSVMLDQTSLNMTGSTMARIPRLRLSNVGFVGTEGLLAFDSSRFRSLEDLRFEGITFLPPSPTPQRLNMLVPLRLKTLVIRSCTNDVYARLVHTLLLGHSPVDIMHLSRFDNHDNRLVYVENPLGTNIRVPCPDTLRRASEAVREMVKRNRDLEHISLHNVRGQTELLTPALIRGLRSLVLPMETPKLKESLQRLCSLLESRSPEPGELLTLILKYQYFTADILQCGYEWMALDRLTDSRAVKLVIFMEYPDDVCSLEETFQVAAPLQFEQFLSRSMANGALRFRYEGFNTIDDFLE